jgi:hypothetical protein
MTTGNRPASGAPLRRWDFLDFAQMATGSAAPITITAARGGPAATRDEARRRCVKKEVVAVRDVPC